jgi:hypothetical protein
MCAERRKRTGRRVPRRPVRNDDTPTRTGTIGTYIASLIRGRGLAGGALLVLLSAARFTASGFAYYPQLDDYIQYYKYTALCSPAEAVIKYGMLAARPLSNAADVFVWANFWGCLFAAVLIISLLYAASAIMFRQVFTRLFPAVFDGAGGTAFVLLYLLLPLNIEGTYWLSASTRVVCGLFWTALSALLFIRWLEDTRLRYAVAFAITQLLAMASYEQALMLTVALTVLIAFVFWGRSRLDTILALLTLSNGLFYWGFILLFRGKSALYANAYGAVSPFTAYFWTDHLPHVIKQFAAAFVGGGALTIIRGAVRGAELIFSDGRIAFALLTLVCAGLTFAYMFAGRSALDEPQKQAANAPVRLLLPLAAGIMLAAAPLVPHVVKANPWFSLRGTVCSLPGISLCAQAVFTYASHLIRERLGAKQALRHISAAAGALFVAVCFVATASELDDYRLTYYHDNAVMSAISEAIPLESAAGRIALVGVEPNYLAEQNFYYHEHIHGVTESDWALSGALYAYSGGTLDPSARFVPLASDAAVQVFAGDSGGYDEIYIYADGKFVRADIN